MSTRGRISRYAYLGVPGRVVVGRCTLHLMFFWFVPNQLQYALYNE